MTAPARQHHVDALRAFAMLLGIAVHAALSFGGTPWIVTDASRSESLRWLYEAIHGFRMQLFFFVSGYFTMLLYRRRGLGLLLEQRFQRVLVPLLLGFVTVVPLLQWVSVWAADTAPRATPAAAGKSPLVEAVRGGDAVAVARLLGGNADPNAPDPEFGIPPVGWAALYGDAGVARLLLEAGADPNGKDRGGHRPLHSAAFLGRPGVAALLLDRGADPAVTGPTGNTPRESAAVDPNATRFLAGVLRVPVPPAAELRAGREACVAELDRRLAARGGGALDAARDRLKGWRAEYREFLTAPGWGLRLSPQGPPVNLLFANQFSHLWFLWFLCWLVAGFGLVAWAAGLVGLPRLPGGLVASPLRVVWLLPLTLGPQLFMGVFGATVGPDTATGVVPYPHLLAYYAVFFAAGAVYHDADDRGGRFGRWWWLWLGVAAAALGPAREHVGDPVVSGPLQVVYAWAMTFGLFGLFRRTLDAESRAVRYVSDAAYWLYLAHLPLVVWAQGWVRGWEYPAWAKFGMICVGSTAVLLLSYQLLVRHTYVGVILNGRRADARPKASAEPSGSPS